MKNCKKIKLLPITFGLFGGLMFGVAYAVYGASPQDVDVALDGMGPDCQCIQREYPPGTKIKKCVKWRCKIKVPRLPI